MIDHVQGPLSGGTQPPNRPVSRGPQRGENAPASDPTDISAGPDSRARLGSASARLEELQRRLSSLESLAQEGEDTGNAQSEVQLDISAAQVAIQNILSSETPGDPAPLTELPRSLAHGLALDPGDVLRLLE